MPVAAALLIAAAVALVGAALGYAVAKARNRAQAAPSYAHLVMVGAGGGGGSGRMMVTGGGGGGGGANSSMVMAGGGGGSGGGQASPSYPPGYFAQQDAADAIETLATLWECSRGAAARRLGDQYDDEDRS